MAYSHPRFSLPTEFDLPDSNDQPVDNELQLLLPTLLRAVLSLAWADRQDWFLGVNLGLYYDPKQPAIGPDAFLSLGVPRYRGSERGLRLSYLLWQEQVVPQWVLEIVSQQPGGEYDKKLAKYAEIGVLYYVVYNPEYWRRDQHEPFELYRLEQGRYVRQAGEPLWMPEIGLGIGRGRGLHEGIEQEWLYWFDELGNRYPAPPDVIVQERGLRLEMERRWLAAEQARLEERQARLKERQARLEAEKAKQVAEQAKQVAEQARQQAEQLAVQEQQDKLEAEQRLRELLERLQQRGIDLDSL
jgi:Uma2 family endonuclease